MRRARLLAVLVLVAASGAAAANPPAPCVTNRIPPSIETECTDMVPLHVSLCIEAGTVESCLAGACEVDGNGACVDVRVTCVKVTDPEGIVPPLPLRAGLPCAVALP